LSNNIFDYKINDNANLSSKNNNSFHLISTNKSVTSSSSPLANLIASFSKEKDKQKYYENSLATYNKVDENESKTSLRNTINSLGEKTINNLIDKLKEHHHLILELQSNNNPSSVINSHSYSISTAEFQTQINQILNTDYSTTTVSKNNLHIGKNRTSFSKFDPVSNKLVNMREEISASLHDDLSNTQYNFPCYTKTNVYDSPLTNKFDDNLFKKVNQEDDFLMYKDVTSIKPNNFDGDQNNLYEDIFNFKSNLTKSSNLSEKESDNLSLLSNRIYNSVHSYNQISKSFCLIIKNRRISMIINLVLIWIINNQKISIKVSISLAT